MVETKQDFPNSFGGLEMKKDIIKRTGIIKVSPVDGVAREIVLRLQGVRLSKVESREIPLCYRPRLYVNQYKRLYSRGK